MKIMFNTMGLGKGGAERVINILSNNLVKNNDVKIVTNINTESAYNFDNKIKITSLEEKKYKKNKISKILGKLSIIKIIKLKKEILEYQPDIIISFLPEPCFRVLFLKMISKKIKQIPIIISVRNDPKIEYSNKIYHYIMKKLYPLSDSMVLQTNESKEYFEKEINKSGTVIFNPVSDEFMIDKYNDKREKRIVAVGRLQPQKNYYLMIDTFEIIHQKHNEYILNIYGDGELKENIQKYIESKELQNHIKLMGKTDNVKEQIYNATAFLMTSDYEGMPNALLEAYCLGIPCVSTDCPCGGPREILNNGENGLLAKVGDAKGLANNICKIIEDKKISYKLSNNCHKTRNRFTKDKIIDEWQKVIDNVKK